MALDALKAQIDIQNFYRARVGREVNVPMIEFTKPSGLISAIFLGAPDVNCSVSPYPYGGINVIATLNFMYKGKFIWTVLEVNSLTPFSDLIDENLFTWIYMDAPANIGEYQSVHSILEENNSYPSLLCRDVKTLVHKYFE